MIYQFKEKVFGSKLSKAEVISRLRSVLEETEDITDAAARGVSRFKAKINTDHPHLLLFRGGFKIKVLNVIIDIEEDIGTNITVKYRIQKLDRYLILFFDIIYWLFLFVILNYCLNGLQPASFLLWVPHLWSWVGWEQCHPAPRWHGSAMPSAGE